MTGGKRPATSRGRSWRSVTVIAACIAAIGAVTAALITTLGQGPGVTVNVGIEQTAGGSASTLSAPIASSGGAAVSSSPPASTPAQAGPIMYTVDPRQWQPKAVGGLTIQEGDTVTITAISGQWSCADVTGWTGIQGSPDYHATYHEWAVPSAPFCSLIGKIGGGPWLQLAPSFQLVAASSGPLALTVNELLPDQCSQEPGGPTSCYTDNKGAIKVQITVSPGS